MKKRLLKIALLLLAVLTTGSVNAATETYNFTGFSNNTILEEGTTTMTINGNVLYAMETADNTFNGRFAVGPSDRTGSGEFVFKNYGEDKGFKIGYAGRFFSILNLEEGDKVTITTATGSNMKFSGTPIVGGGATDGGLVTSGAAYTVSSAGNLNLAANADGTYIESIVIETTSVPVTINIIPDATTEEYDFQTFAKNLTGDAALLNFTLTGDDITNGASRKVKVIKYGTEEFGGRFAVNKTNIVLRKHATDAYNGIFYQQKWTDIYFSVLNLKNGDKIKFEGTNISQLAFDGTPALKKGDVAVKSSDALEANTVYTVSTEASSVTLDFVTKDCSSKNLYIHKITIESLSSTGTYIGATLVSDKALDFTDVDGITAYVATEANAGTVTFSPVTKVAANTPLYIKANATSGSAINVDVPVATEGAVDYSATNLLKGSASKTTSLTSEAGTKYYYVFGVQDNTEGFYRVSTSSTFTSAAGKAYLELTADQVGTLARSIRMIFGDGSDITGINTAVVEKESRDDAWYTLQGARVSKPAHGIYIKNGKKIFVK